MNPVELFRIKHVDERGLFEELYKVNRTLPHFVQFNYSESKKGVLRGLHYQKAPFAQSKLVSVLEGMIQDVVVNLDTKEVSSYILTPDKQLFVPNNYAHGFLVLSDTAKVLYGVDKFYNKYSEGGIRYDDKHLNIEWLTKNPILSTKDSKYSCSNGCCK